MKKYLKILFGLLCLICFNTQNVKAENQDLNDVLSIDVSNLEPGESMYIEKYFVTTTYYNNDGEIIDIKNEIVDKDTALQVASNNISVASDSGWDSYYQTDAKRMGITTGRYTDNTSLFFVSGTLWWLTEPNIKKYDVFATRWEGNGTAIKVLGQQIGYKKNNDVYGTTTYSETSKNTKIANNGVGISMNLYDNAVGYTLDLYVQIQSDSSKGISEIFLTYQHAVRTSITLDISQSYTFGAGGLGNVMKLNSSSLSSYFDHMAGMSSTSFPLHNRGL